MDDISGPVYLVTISVETRVEFILVETREEVIPVETRVDR